MTFTSSCRSAFSPTVNMRKETATSTRRAPASSRTSCLAYSSGQVGHWPRPAKMREDKARVLVSTSARASAECGASRLAKFRIPRLCQPLGTKRRAPGFESVENCNGGDKRKAAQDPFVAWLGDLGAARGRRDSRMRYAWLDAGPCRPPVQRASFPDRASRSSAGDFVKGSRGHDRGGP